MQSFSLNAMIDVQTLPPTGALIGRLDTTETERAELAQRFGYLSVDALGADLRIKRAAKGAWDVRGKLHAEISQACIVTGEPVSESVDFEIEERYVLASVPKTRSSSIWETPSLWSTAALISAKWSPRCWHCRQRHGHGVKELLTIFVQERTRKPILLPVFPA